MTDVTRTMDKDVTISMTLKNTGSAVGTWTLSFAFEGDISFGSNVYTPVTLAANETKTISWTVNVPDIPNGRGQLVIYYDYGTIAYPAPLTQYFATEYFLNIVGLPELAFTSVLLS